MRVLCHGLPFFRDYAVLDAYTGPHEIRTVSANADTRYRYEPMTESWPELVARISREWPPDLALFWTPENDPPPPDVELSPIPTVALAGDWNLFYGAQQYNLGRYDVVLCDKPGVAILSNDMVRPRFLFPLYAHDPLLNYDRRLERDIDVLYLGNMNLAHYRRRGPLLERLARLADRYRVVLACGVFGDAYGQLLSRAKIVFNHSVRGELNLRVFESVAAGALAFIETDNAEVRHFFSPDEEVVLYTAENLEARIGECLEHWDQWRHVARRAQERSKDFSCEQRLDQLLDWVVARLPGERKFTGLPESERLLQSYLMYAVSQRAEYGPIEQTLAARLVNTLPDDPRAWTAVGRSFYAPKQPTDERARGKRCIAALARAAALQPDAAPFAMNAAEACRLWGLKELEEKYLDACIAATSLDGAEWLLGDYQSVFWTRWLRALAENRSSLAMLHAEAHARRARLLAERERLEEAMKALEQAEHADPESTSGTILKAELLLKQQQKEAATEYLWQYRNRFFFDFDYRDALVALLLEIGRVEDAEMLRREGAVMQKAYYPEGYGAYQPIPPGIAATARD